MNKEKLRFLKYEALPLLQKLDGKAKGRWGVMNGQEMAEHLVDVVRNASGRLVLPPVNKGEMLEKARAFLLSDKPFRENTKNPMMGDVPAPLRKASMQEVTDKLLDELEYFFHAFENSPELTTGNMFFGDLDYAMNIQLLHKHFMHHFRQFGLVD
jgi:hypothetical protein